MRYVPQVDKENLMLVNVIYHEPRKHNDYKDRLDIVYKLLDTGEKRIESIPEPEMEIFFTKQHKRTHKHNKSFERINDLDMHTCKYKNVLHYIAKQAGPQYQNYLKECMSTRNMARAKNLHKYNFVYGSDYDIVNWARVQWVINNDNTKAKPITKQFLDIEADTIGYEGFPKNGECPINAVTIIDEVTMTSYTLLLRNPENPLIQEFEDTIDDFVDELHAAFDESYGKLDYKIYMYDSEKQMLIDLFKIINTLKRDFVLIWNMGFDIPYIIERCHELGLDPATIICHPDFVEKTCYYKKDTLNFAINAKSDNFKVSSYSVYYDQMVGYAGLRKGRGELRSHALNNVAKVEIGDEKLDYSEDANIKTLPYVDYKKFVMYNIKDVLLQMGIERKTNDIENVYQRSYVNATEYSRVFKQTIFLKNRAYIEFYKQGLIIGNNVNIDYGVPMVAKKDEEEKEKFDGALVADPEKNDFVGIKVLGLNSKYIFDNVVDMDFSSMYPNIIICFNIAPNCMIGKLHIDSNYADICKNYGEVENFNENLGKKFVENMLIGNEANMGTEWFGLPGIEELARGIEKEYGLNKSSKLTIDEKYGRMSFPMGVNIKIS